MLYSWSCCTTKLSNHSREVWVPEAWSRDRPLWSGTVIFPSFSPRTHMVNDAYTQCPQPQVDLGWDVILGYWPVTQHIFLLLKKECWPASGWHYHRDNVEFILIYFISSNVLISVLLCKRIWKFNKSLWCAHVDYLLSVTDLIFVMGSHSTGSLWGGDNACNLTVNVIKVLSSLNSLMWITQSLLVNTQHVRLPLY